MTPDRAKKKVPTRPAKTSRAVPSHNGKRTPLSGSQHYETFAKPGRTPDPGPRRIEGESLEDREKRLAARKARTLKVFQKAYENRHPKTS